MTEQINEAGKIAGSIAALIGLVAIFWKPIKTRLRQRGSFQRTVISKLDSIAEDIFPAGAGVNRYC